MTPEDFDRADRALRELNQQAVQKLLGTANDTQAAALRQALRDLDGLEVDGDVLEKRGQEGAIRRIVQRFLTVLTDEQRSGWLGAVEALAADAGAGENIIGNMIFEPQLGGNFRPIPWARDNALNSLKRSLQPRVVNGQLVAEGQVWQRLAEPLGQLVREHVEQGARLEALTGRIREFFGAEGTEYAGRLAQYAGQVGTDGINQYQALYIQETADGLGFEYYRYAGGIRPTTRSFCAARAGKVYHKSEVEGWASLSWDGKHRRTTGDSIYTVRGGYHCQHRLLPVANRFVPESVKRRVEGAA
jgi:hypothetical protein